MSKVVLLTGAAGFIGSNFLEYLFDRYPNYYFLVLDSLTYAGNQENIPTHIKNSQRFEFWYGSVTNADIVQSLMSRANLVVHFAAESHVARSIFDNSKFFETDVIGTQVMMNALLKNNTIERFIHISSSEVYGTAETQPMTEDHPLNPRSPYAGAKAGADRLVYSYWSTYDLPALIIRPFNNYGPRQHLEKMIPRFVTSALCEQPLTIHGNGSAQRDWIFVQDHCKALDQALHLPDFSKIKNQVINLGTGVATSNLDIAQVILKEFGLSSSNLKFIGDRPGQVHCHISSVDKAQELLNWKATTTLQEGLRQVITWYKNNESYWRKLEWMKEVPIYTSKNTIELH
jgi:dTDP-glucose 4,6-dehydratase